MGFWSLEPYQCEKSCKHKFKDDDKSFKFMFQDELSFEEKYHATFPKLENEIKIVTVIQNGMCIASGTLHIQKIENLAHVKCSSHEFQPSSDTWMNLAGKAH